MSSKVNRHVIIIIIIIIDLSLNSLCFLIKFFNKQLTKAITIVEFKQKKQQPILLAVACRLCSSMSGRGSFAL